MVSDWKVGQNWLKQEFVWIQNFCKNFVGLKTCLDPKCFGPKSWIEFQKFIGAIRWRIVTSYRELDSNMKISSLIARVLWKWQQSAIFREPTVRSGNVEPAPPPKKKNSIFNIPWPYLYSIIHKQTSLYLWLQFQMIVLKSQKVQTYEWVLPGLSYPMLVMFVIFPQRGY